MKLFSKVRNVNDIKDIFFKNYDSSNPAYLPDVVESGLNSLNNLGDVAKNNLVIYSDIIDSYFGLSKDQVIIQDKLKTILTTSILLDKCYDETKVLNEKEFLTLAYFLTYEDPILVNSYVKLYNKEILNLVCSRFNDYSLREELLEIINIKFLDKEINTEEEMFKYISDIDDKEIRLTHLNLMNEIAYQNVRGVI